MTPPVPLRVPDPPPGAEAVAWVALLVGAVIVLLLLRRGPRKPWRALLAAVLVLAGAEMAVRAYEATQPLPSYRPAGQVIWMLAPDLRDAPVGPPERRTWVDTNSLGLRDAEIPAQKPPGELRILALGDSWTLGVEMTPEQTWVKRLEQRLQEHHKGRVRVINAGQNGFSYLQGYHLMRHLVPLYEPDLVLVGGFVPVSEEEIAVMEELESSDPRLDDLLRTLNGSRLYRILRKRFAPRTRSNAPPRDVFEGSVRYAQAMARYLSDRRVPAVFFQRAFAPASRRDAIGLPVQPILTSLPELPGIAAIEVEPGRDAAADGLLLEHDPTHPNARGHEAMAEALAPYLTQALAGAGLLL